MDLRMVMEGRGDQVTWAFLTVPKREDRTLRQMRDIYVVLQYVAQNQIITEG